jgi:sugar phosphate isomerase/epimerase
VSELQGICLFSAALRGFPASVVADIAVGAGLEAVEWAVGPTQPVSDPAEAGELVELSRERGLVVPCVTVQGADEALLDPESLRPYMRLAQGLESPYVRVFTPRYSGALASELRRARNCLGQAAELAHDHGVALLIEVSPGTLAPSTLHARELLRGLGETDVGVLYDPGNMVIEGHIQPGLATAELGTLLKHLHVKNIEWLRDASGWRWRHAPLADGLLDWSRLAECLRQADYRGWLSLDHLPGEPSAESLTAELAALRAIVGTQATSGEPSAEE